jgi:hypothetical protein
MRTDWRSLLRGLAIAGALQLGLYAAAAMAKWMGWPREYGLWLGLSLIFTGGNVYIVRREFRAQGYPVLIRWAACMGILLSLAAILIVSPMITSHGHWWSVPLVLLLTAKVVVEFGKIGRWAEPLPSGLVGGRPNGPVHDRWLDGPG